jgi:hypothetical protein
MDRPKCLRQLAPTPNRKRTSQGCIAFAPLLPLIYAAFLIAGAHVAQAGINVWTAHGPYGSPVQVLAIDPHTPSTLYAGTRGHGVYRSSDSGVSWSAIGLTGSQVNALAIHPSTPSTLYAATNGDGVHQSTDSGANWSAINTGLPNPYVLALAIDPRTPSTLYAGNNSGVFKSTSSGASWNTILPITGVTALAIDPRTPSTLYAGTVDIHGGGVFQSTDSGASWTALNGGLTNGVALLAIDPSTPSTLYAAGGWPLCGFGCSGGGLFQSTDSGASWSAINTDLNVSALAIDPHTPSTLYAGTAGGVFHSTDSGATWSVVNRGLTVGVWALAIDPHTPSTLYAEAGGGVFSIQQVAVCTGDCDGSGAVGVNEIITLVNIALGTAQPSVCADGGLPIGGDVTIAVLVQAVNHALTSCAGG